MKRINLLLILTVITFSVSAQFKIGVQGGIYNTWLLNSNISDAGKRIDQAATFKPQFGVQAIYLFNEQVGISTGASISNYAQNWDGEIGDSLLTINYEGSTSLKSIDVPLLLRIESEGGTYFEVGPLFSFISGAEETYEFGDPNIDYEDRDFSNDFNTFNVAANIGFGVSADLSDDLELNIGLNLGYGFADVSTEYTDQELIDSEELSIYNFEGHRTNDDTDPFNYESTNTAFGGLKIGFIYIIR